MTEANNLVNVGTADQNFLDEQDDTLQASPDSIDPNQVDEYFFNIDFSHNDNTIKILTNSLMALNRTDNGCINRYELIDQLERIDRYKPALLHIFNSLEKELGELEIERDIWYSELCEDARMAIVAHRILLKTEQGIPASTFTGITKEDVKNEILSNDEHKTGYLEYEEALADLKFKKETVEGLRKDLHNRSFTLQKLVDLFIQDNQVIKII